jgi:xanthine dehydrogenase accessory factor
MAEIYDALKNCLAERQLVALATVIAGPGLGNKLLVWPDGRTRGDLGGEALNRGAAGRAVRLMRTSQVPERAAFETDSGAAQVFIDVHPPPPRLVIVGAVHIAIPLVTYARTLGFHTTVVDARSAFATEDRFRHADELIVAWPDRALEGLSLDAGSYVVVLSHDEKLDNPALHVALNSPARYIGALGSRKTHAKRVRALKEMGVADEQLARIHAPIGLNLGAQTPEEIALAIMAEILAAQRGVGQGGEG